MSALDEARDKTGEALDVLYALIRTRETFGPDHSAAVQQARALGERLQEAHPPFTLQLAEGVAFRDKELVPLDPARYARVRELSRAAAAMGIGEIGVDRAVDEAGAQALAEGFGAALRGRVAGPPQVAGLWWAEALPVQWGVDAEQVDAETFARSQVALAVRDARRLRAAPSEGRRAWDFVAGLSCVRRLQEAVELDAIATVRALERAPTGWDAARRAASAACWGLLLADTVALRAPVSRAIAHTALVLACTGFDEQGGRGPQKAAGLCMPQVLASPAPTRSGISPHRLRVLGLLDAIAQGTPVVPAAPVIIAHSLERQRLDAQARPRARAALVAWLASRRPEDPWSRVLLATPGADTVVADTVVSAGPTSA
ncbi:MAG: hypothetical protein H6742_17245 [Alphaproteobacteria bacterium]|nr:hypothetical protein [Alphaproteobacteria bacterium]